MPKRRAARAGQELADATVEAIEDLAAITAALERAKALHYKSELSRRPKGAFTIQEYRCAYTPPMSPEAARVFLEKQVKLGTYQRGQVRMVIGDRLRAVYVYWENKK